MTSGTGAGARHFLDLDDFDTATLRSILERGNALKKAGRADKPLAGKTLAMIFEKPSTRTRVSFEVGMRQLGGDVVMLSSKEMQLGRGETVADTAKVLSRFVDVIMLRTDSEEKLLELAEHATVPVINGLTDRTHPCQIVADIMTIEERMGPIAGRKVAWSGDGNNVAASLIHAAVRLNFKLALACPPQLNPEPAVLEWARREGGEIELTDDADAAVAVADCVVTDTWVSMGQEQDDVRRRKQLLGPYAVDADLMRKAAPDAIFLHCP